MGFPANWPDFTNDQRRRLKQLGVTDEQVRQLRHALYVICVHVSPRANPSATRERLKEIEKHAKALARKLRFAEPSEQQALALLDREYWHADAARVQEQLEAGLTPEPLTGPTVQHRVLPELDLLIAAASSARAEVPKGRPGTRNTASPSPVEAIVHALLMGFLKADGRTFIVRDDYPEALKPSAAENCAFREIVGICYQAVGGNPDPLRAIRAFLAKELAKRNEILDGFDEALHLESRDATRKAREGKRTRKRN